MESYARLTGRSKSHVAMEALSEYLARRTPQIGEFATDEEVEAVFERLTAPPRRARRK